MRACCAPESFAAAVEGMRSAHETKADVALTLLPLLSRLSSRDDSARLIMDIMERFTEDADSSRFGLLNAVTSVARDTRDPGNALAAGRTWWRNRAFAGPKARSRRRQGEAVREGHAVDRLLIRPCAAVAPERRKP